MTWEFNHINNIYRLHSAIHKLYTLVDYTIFFVNLDMHLNEGCSMWENSYLLPTTSQKQMVHCELRFQFKVRKSYRTLKIMICLHNDINHIELGIMGPII